jgi:signal transduction histidine kinase
MELLDSFLTIRQYLHDLAQPMAAVTGLVDLMLLEMDERDPLLREVQMISEELEKVLQVIGEIRRIAWEASGGDRMTLSSRPAAV